MSDRFFLYKPIIGICKQYTSLPCVARDVCQPLEWTESESIVILDNVGLNSCCQTVGRTYHIVGNLMLRLKPS